MQVKNWGSGKPKDLGKLEVESFESDTQGLPFYERLSRRVLQIDPRHEVCMPLYPTSSIIDSQHCCC